MLKQLLTQEKVLLLLQLLIIGFISTYYVLNGIFPSLDIVIALTVTLFIWKSKQRALLKDLLPFFLLLLTYQSLRGFADNLSPSEIHITDLITWEKSIFNGWIPAYVIQQQLPTTPGAKIIIILANLLYMAHFVTPIIVAVCIWYYRKNSYWPYIFGLLVLTYGAFITYFFFPAAPPWWATKFGYLPDQPVTLSAFVYPTLVEFFGPNPVAAMPSLHMGYPSYICIYILFLWGKKALWILLLPILVGLSTLILGHHYVIDLIFGILFALIAWLVSIPLKHLLVNRSIVSESKQAN